MQELKRRGLSTTTVTSPEDEPEISGYPRHCITEPACSKPGHLATWRVAVQFLSTIDKYSADT